MAEPRLQRRYASLVVAHMSPAHRVAAGPHDPAACSPMAAAQAAWRFYANPALAPDVLAGPLVACARAAVAAGACGPRVLVALDWCNLHYNGHPSKADRVELSRRRDLGYELLTALALSDRDGAPLAPVCLELRAADGVHSTRAPAPLPAASPLDALGPVMAHVRGLGLGREPVFVVDREADSVGHYRAWDAAGDRFVVRADDARLVRHGGGGQARLGAVADRLRRGGRLADARAVELDGRPARQFVGEAAVVLHRPARPHRADRRGRGRRRKRRAVPGRALPLRLVVSEVRDPGGRVLARWLLLTNVPAADAGAATVALWYYWRWRVETYHKLLKAAGQRVEDWQQETAAALARRLCVAAMACVAVWRLARDPGPAAAELRAVLVRASGRRVKRGRDAAGRPRRPFTEPALLAGLGVLLPALALLDDHTPGELRAMAAAAIPLLTRHPAGPPGRREGG